MFAFEIQFSVMFKEVHVYLSCFNRIYTTGHQLIGCMLINTQFVCRNFLIDTNNTEFAEDYQWIIDGMEDDFIEELNEKTIYYVSKYQCM